MTAIPAKPFMKTLGTILITAIAQHALCCLDNARAASPVLVATGYYDNPPAPTQGGSNLPLPVPWYGGTNTTYYGSSATATNSDPDICAILLENLGPSTVTLSAANIGGSYDLFALDSITNPIPLPPNQFVILAGPDGSDVSFVNIVNLTIDSTNFSFNDLTNQAWYPEGVLHGFEPDFTDGTIPWTTIYTPDIVNPPAFIAITNFNNTNTITWSASFGQVYQLASATNLTLPFWTDLGAIQTASGTTVTFIDPATSPQKFYRVRLLLH